MSDPLDPRSDRDGDPSGRGHGRDGSEGRARSVSANDPIAPENGPAGPSRAGRDSAAGGLGDSSIAGFLLDILSSVFVVAMIGLFLFAASGVWPPLVAVESGSMEPHIQKGDLVFVMENDRFAGPGAHASTGVVTARAGSTTGYRSFQGYGDVIVYRPDGNTNATPIIHRAMFWVEADENWFDQADPSYRGHADNCRELRHCPAPHAGFITKGDHNGHYDQVLGGISGPVKPSWVVGTAQMRVPLLGQIRLASGTATESSP